MVAAKCLTGIERTSLSLARKSTDHLAFCEHFWSGARNSFVQQGMQDNKKSMAQHFNFDIDEMFAVNYTANLSFKEQIVEENESTVTILDGNGATMKKFKNTTGVPEHIAFSVENRGDYFSNIYPHISVPDESRIMADGYLRVKQECKAANRFFCLTSAQVFELMHPVCGHENLLAGMVEDPEWIAGMAMDYARMIVAHFEILFEKCGKPDGVWFWEDLGFKERPFMSPAMYKELIMPAHKYVFDFCKGHNLPVIFHSCGFVEPLIPLLIEAGINCLQAMEVKAGMNPVRIKKAYGNEISLMGGIDVRLLCENNIEKLDLFLKDFLPQMGNGYIMHSDHSIPGDVALRTFEFYRSKALQHYSQ